MKKIVKKLSTMIIAFLIMVASVLQTNAAADSIQLGSASKTNPYIAGVSFSYKVTTSGKYLYCLNKHKNTAANVKATLVKNSNYINGGVVNILKNGYPNNSITGDKDKDYYITQTAIWWYLDITTGSSNLGQDFKETGSDSYAMRHFVKGLVDEGYNHRNDSISIPETKLALSATGGTSLTVKDGYYISNDIKASTAKNVADYTITLKDAPKGAVIVRSNGKEVDPKNGVKVSSNETFKVKIPVSSITNTKTTFKVEANSGEIINYTAYEYQPTDSSMQNVTSLEKITSKASASIVLGIDTSKVTITKIDSTTKKPIAGAKLVVKNSAGKEVASWTTTTNSYVINGLANGTYTVEETAAPSGYTINKTPVKFTITDTNRDVKVTFENSKKGKVTITKVDSTTKKPIAGAKLVLKDSKGNTLASWTSTINAHIINDLENGDYTIEETAAPSGYLLNKNITKFTITDTNKDVKVTFENAPKNVVVNITKVDSETNAALAGAVLLVKDSTGKEIAKFTTTNTSYVLKDLANGTYTVEEVSAPSGYMRSTDVIKFTVDDDHLSHQIIFKNTKEVPVPNTDDMTSILLLAIGVLIIGLGFTYIKKNANA